MSSGLPMRCTQCFCATRILTRWLYSVRKLQKENVIPECPIVPDVALLTPEHMKSVKFLTAGFPCPDIGISGPKLGFTGDRSALFAWVVKAAAMAPDLEFILFENVANIVSKDMKCLL